MPTPEDVNLALLFICVNGLVAITVPLVAITIPEFIKYIQGKGERERQLLGERFDLLDAATQTLLETIAQARKANASVKVGAKDDYYAILRRDFYSWERAAWRLADPFDGLELDKMRKKFSSYDAHNVASWDDSISENVILLTRIIQMKAEKNSAPKSTNVKPKNEDKSTQVTN